MKKLATLCLILLCGCSVFSKHHRLLGENEDKHHNNWLEKKHHYRGLASIED